MNPTTYTRLSTAPVHAVLPAEDIDRAARFYGDTLGLDVESRNDDRGELYLSAGSGTHILVYRRARTKAEHTAAEFEVDDLRATMQELRDRGVRFEDYDMPNLKTRDGVAETDDSLGAWFTDPEGNIVALMQWKR